MKKFKIILSITLALVICAALYISNGIRAGEYSKTQFLFDTECTIRAGGKNAKNAVNTAFERAGELEEMFDYYSDSSVVAQINSATAGEEIPLDEDIFAVLSLAEQTSSASGGTFDITIAPVKDLWNFNTEFPTVPYNDNLQTALKSVNHNYFTLNSDKKSIIKLNEYAKIDLGGAAKGYAADAVRQSLEENGAEYAVIDFGGNVVVFGNNPKNKNGKWKIGIQNPFAPTGEYSDTVEISEGAVVTSGIYERNFTVGGKLYHHILSPENGYPVENNLASVTIVHQSSAVADCLSTACFVLGEERGRELAETFGAEIYFQYRNEQMED